MQKKSKLGVYLHTIYLGNEYYTVTNRDSITFIDKLKLADTTILAVSVQPAEVDTRDFTVVAEQRGIEVIRLPGWRSIAGSLPFVLFSFKKMLHKALELVEKSDVVWMRVPSIVALFFWWAAKKKKKPLITHVVGNVLLAPRRPVYRGVRRLFAYGFSYVLHILTRFMRRYGITLTAGGQLRDLLSTRLYPAYVLDDVLLVEEDIHPPKRSKNPSQILFVGRFDYGKGINILIDAIGSLRNELPDIHLRMVGDGPLVEEAKKQVSELGLEDNIELVGFISANGPLQKIYTQADIFVLPSDTYPEGFPRVIHEAWAAGLPVVATRMAGIPYRVEDGTNGLLVTPGDCEELTDALRRLINDPDLCFKLAKGGVQTVRHLTFERQRDFVVKLLNRHYPEFRTPDRSYY